ncbi:SWIM zinc finger domain-containing protein [Luteolibacter arcticus]|uniref:SWIM zinc finger domain-containing protein n=1 Tax=Luteolibacter arcticus TaxID=1581411 RepID=A0ABT3GF46_9BACT|nr:SWIM zinc finger family protein [Luteolibacter arcticus]MCW1922231.1 SWIM zinc finger domain-containing protein [Luteolibacter arcticus]
MIFQYQYRGFSRVGSTPRSTAMTFVPDGGRPPMAFNGLLRDKLPFREAICAMHRVVTGDLRWKPKEREDYKAWAATQEEVWLAEFMERAGEIKGQVSAVREELDTLRSRKWEVMTPFRDAKQRYFQHIYKWERIWWIVLDPVITVHPDQVFFECFSQDESSYARLSCTHDVFEKVGDFTCGTTNIDYSAPLYDEFRKIRDYKETALAIDPGGFEVKTGDDPALREEKIDVPDSWVRGFLQVSSAMTLDGIEVDLDPMDFHAICFHLKRKKERHGPRSLRFRLNPGQPPVIIVDPWGTEIVCRRSFHHAKENTEIRLWGRRRLLVLEAMIPLARRVKVRLLGYGMPSFWQVDMGALNFTLGLSGWTANDWSRAGQFDLMAPRTAVSTEAVEMVLGALNRSWFSSASSLAAQLSMPPADVLGALVAGTQAGLVVKDPGDDLWRARALSREPLPLDRLRFSNEREAKARELFQRGSVKVEVEERIGERQIAGIVDDGKTRYPVEAVIDADERLVRAKCSCNFFQQNRLRLGPCEHVLAARMAKARYHFSAK